jgi:hypothetical protein
MSFLDPHHFQPFDSLFALLTLYQNFTDPASFFYGPSIKTLLTLHPPVDFIVELVSFQSLDDKFQAV